jgi:predicted Holliday junction resolvase-like endonuclease
MINPLLNTIDGLQEILGICPCCEELFRLVEAKFIFPTRKARTSRYLDLISLENRISTENDLLTVQEDTFNIEIQTLIEQWRESGRRQAKSKLMKIDPVFSANKIDPQEVKAIMHPVEYIIFHGLCSDDGVDALEFISRKPTNKGQEIIATSIGKAIEDGYVSFETLRMLDDGSFEIKEA